MQWRASIPWREASCQNSCLAGPWGQTLPDPTWLLRLQLRPFGADVNISSHSCLISKCPK